MGWEFDSYFILLIAVFHLKCLKSKEWSNFNIYATFSEQGILCLFKYLHINLQDISISSITEKL